MSSSINDCFKIAGNDIIIKVKIIPGSSKNKIIGIYADTLKIAITSPPVESKANKKCISYLSKHFDIAKSKIEILSGKNSRNKLIKIYNINQNYFLEKLGKIV
ncbi:MAG: YggU family protein [Candidatus Atribacteria bacterium]|nr:YggU family protein [Candidatus Atribacteria bacterium]